MVKRDYSMDGDGRISDDDVATYPTDGVANRDHRGKQVWVCTPGTSHVNVNSSLHLIDLFVEYGTVTVVGRMMRHLATMLTTRGTPRNTMALRTTMMDYEGALETQCANRQRSASARGRA